MRACRDDLVKREREIRVIRMGNCYGISFITTSSQHGSTNNNNNTISSAHNHSSTSSLSTLSSFGLCSKVMSTSSIASSSIGSSCTVSSSWNTVDLSNPMQAIATHLHCFPFRELKSATRNFHSDNLLGEGGFGPVFKGWISHHSMKADSPGTGITIAVKKLNPRSLQGHKEFMAEVHFLGQLHHPNLVKLLGYCAEEDQKLLVYEYMPRGSLDAHLFRSGSEPMSWTTRLKVILDSAKGLAFLHDASVIYRDFKASNVLLDTEYNAKISDFGLAKGGPPANRTHVSTLIRGTLGYAAPEYLTSGHLTTKCDIYSFGVVLLEVITGRRSIDKNRPQNEQSLVKWARPCLRDKRKLPQILDPKLDGQISSKDAHGFATLTLSCLRHTANARPEMKSVVAALEFLMQIDN